MFNPTPPDAYFPFITTESETIDRLEVAKIQPALDVFGNTVTLLEASDGNFRFKVIAESAMF